jgi:hypothetical protein
VVNRKVYRTAVVCLVGLFLFTRCSSVRTSIDRVIPIGTQQAIAGTCKRYETEWKPQYEARRSEVIANRDWLEELLPNVWGALVYLDEHRAEVDRVVTLLCRLFSGDGSAEAELQVARIDLERRGVNWQTVLLYAVEIAKFVAEARNDG